MIRIGSLFSGIEGLGSGFEWVFGDAARIAFQVESNAFCRRILNHYWPDVPKFKDVRDVGARNLPGCDILIGGFPEDVSSAGPRVGLSGPRSGLWFEFARIAAELSPEWIVVENVTSGANKWVTPVRCSLAELGYETIPIPLSASACGAPHRRSRVFIVGHTSAVANTNSEPIRLDEQRLSRRQPSRVQDEGQAELVDAGAHMADSRRKRRKEQPTARVHAARQSGDDAARRHIDLRWEWPPGPEDWEGWESYLARGGPQPGVRRGADRAARRLHRDQLRALGNAVTPQQAAVIACVVKLLMERMGNQT